MLVDDQPMEFVDEQVKFVLALNLVMLLREYLLLNFWLPYLVDSREQKDDTYEDHFRLTLVIQTVEGFGEQNVQCKPQVNEPACSEQNGSSIVVVW